MAEDIVRVAEAGDSVESIASEHGHIWRTLWEHPRNQALRELRKSPHTLVPGDHVYVPALRQRTKQVLTGRKHTFVRKGIPSKLHLVLRVGSEVLKDTPYALEVDGVVLQGRSGPDGSIVHAVSPTATTGMLRIGEGFASRLIPISLRHLHPLDTVTGVQGRLQNLGYPVEEVNGELDGPTQAALQRFRADQQLPSGAGIDDSLRSALQRVYGH